MKQIIVITFSWMFMWPMTVQSQKNCNNPLSGFVPLPELQGKSFRGYTGELYATGNVPAGAYLTDAIQAAKAIQPLDKLGNPSANGVIIMAGVGASNPRTEFNAFMQKMATAQGLNPNVRWVNTCIGGQGIQKMNQPTDNYWNATEKLFDSLGYDTRQVQVIWVETDNTQVADTSFPGAPVNLMHEMKTLLQTMKSKFPNARLCYFSARGYSGWVDQLGGATAGKGLLHPRDYYNGWAIKWLIESADSAKSGFRYSEPNAEIIQPLFASYHYADGETPLQNGFFLDCETDIGNDGLHLSPAGETKIGQEMFNFFMNDTLSSLWMLAQTATNSFISTPKLKIYPNPTSESIYWDLPHPDGEIWQIQLLNDEGKCVRTERITPGQSHIQLSDLPPGLYHLLMIGKDEFYQARFLKSQ